MPTVLNNTQRDFHAFTAPSPGSSALTRTVVKPGFNNLSDRQLDNMRGDSHFMRAVSQDAIIINGNDSDRREAVVKPTDVVPESPDARASKVASPVEVRTRPDRKPKTKRSKKDDSIDLDRDIV